MGSREILMPIDPEALRAAVNPWLGHAGYEQGVDELFNTLARTSEGYGAVWRRFVNWLKESRSQVASSLEGQEEADRLPEFDNLVSRLEGIGSDVSNARRRMLRMGILVERPLDRAFRAACALASNRTPDSLTPEEVQAYVQDLYNRSDSALACTRTMMETLKSNNTVEDQEFAFLIRTLESALHSGLTVNLRRRGIVLDEKKEVCARTQFQEGDSEGGRRGIKAVLRRRARLSPMKLEELRMKEAVEKQFPYAGRRRDIRDWRGHHPFISKIEAANLARELTRSGRAWEYRPRGFYKRGQYLEPDFWLPEEKRYLVIVPSAGGQARMLEKARKKAGQQALAFEMEIELEFVPQARYRSGAERSRTRTRTGDRRFSIMGPNIATDPSRFLLAEDECPCGICDPDRGRRRLESYGRKGREMY